MVKKSMKKLFVSLAALSTASLFASETSNLTTSQNFFQPRAFSANLAREMLMEGTVHRDSEGWYGVFSADAAYQRSWGQNIKSEAGVEQADAVNGLGTHPFWSGTNVMTTGNASGTYNVDAYQFGLGPVSTTGSVTLNPIVYQAGADFMFIVGSSANQPCFFAKIKAPVGVYNINPQLAEEELTAVSYPAYGLANSATTGYQPATTMTQAFAGNLSGGEESGQGDFVPMQYGLINGDISTGAKFGDIEMTAGYRFISNSDNSFSVAVRAAAPTGGQATGVYMMEPIFGRGGNWGLGGYLDGHVKVWEGNNENSIVLKFIGNAMHLFNADTVRSYDLLANGGGSKYLLVANYSDTAYQSQVANLINYSTLASTSSFGVEGDFALAFTYMGRGWSVDLGYEFWGRSAETLVITEDFANSYAVLGRQTVNSTYALCEPAAKISEAQAAATAATPTIVSALTAANRVALADLDVAGAQQATALTSKVFSKVAYEWADSDYRPHLGVMGEFEMSMCDNNALPQWSVALIGGVSF